MTRRIFRRRGLLVAALVVFLAASQSAWAHSFLISSDPPAGSRLQSAPKAMTLNFSEAFVAGSEQVTLRHYGGGKVQLVKPQSRGVTLTQPLPRDLRGVFVVSWRVLSDDGHIS